MIRWTRERAGHDPAYFAKSIPQLAKWIAGEVQPTLNQLENLANRTHTHLGYLFLSEPPDERLPISDYRTLTGSAPKRPSPDLLDTLYTIHEIPDQNPAQIPLQKNRPSAPSIKCPNDS